MYPPGKGGPPPEFPPPDAKGGKGFGMMPAWPDAKGAGKGMAPPPFVMGAPAPWEGGAKGKGKAWGGGEGVPPPFIEGPPPLMPPAGFKGKGPPIPPSGMPVPPFEPMGKGKGLAPPPGMPLPPLPPHLPVPPVLMQDPQTPAEPERKANAALMTGVLFVWGVGAACDAEAVEDLLRVAAASDVDNQSEGLLHCRQLAEGLYVAEFSDVGYATRAKLVLSGLELPRALGGSTLKAATDVKTDQGMEMWRAAKGRELVQKLVEQGFDPPADLPTVVQEELNQSVEKQRKNVKENTLRVHSERLNSGQEISGEELALRAREKERIQKYLLAQSELPTEEAKSKAALARELKAWKALADTKMKNPSHTAADQNAATTTAAQNQTMPDEDNLNPTAAAGTTATLTDLVHMDLQTGGACVAGSHQDFRSWVLSKTHEPQKDGQEEQQPQQVSDLLLNPSLGPGAVDICAKIPGGGLQEPQANDMVLRATPESIAWGFVRREVLPRADFKALVKAKISQYMGFADSTLVDWFYQRIEGQAGAEERPLDAAQLVGELSSFLEIQDAMDILAALWRVFIFETLKFKYNEHRNQLAS